MSSQDKKILRFAELTQRELSECLGVTEQAVSSGINSTRHYLNPERLRKAFQQLARDPAKAELLRRSVETILPGHVMTLYEPGREITDNDPSRQDFCEMWVISREPQELTEIGYLEEMVSHHWKNENKVLEYFVPPGDVADRLTKAVKRSLLESASSATIRVFRLAHLQISPHYVIFEPSDADQFYGMVKTHAFEFVRLHPHDTKVIIIALNELKRDGVAELVFDSAAESTEDKP